MSIISDLVYNRTELDVSRWLHLRNKGFAAMTLEERVEWMAGMRGAYTPTYDMNRVGEAVAYVAGVFEQYGYIVDVHPKTDWTERDIPTLIQLNDYLRDVSALRGALPVYDSTPRVPGDMVDLTIEEANAIEKILVDVDDLLQKLAAAWFKSGELQSGEV